MVARPMVRALALALAFPLVQSMAAGDAAAQPAPAGGEPFFKGPVFVLMPGAVVTPVIDGIGNDELGIYGNEDTKAYFNVRFMTVVPTKLPWFQLVAGVQFQPNAQLPDGTKAGRPQLFYGTILPFPAVTTASNGWLGLSLDAFALYSAGGGGTTRYPYGHDLTLEGALTVNFGPMMMPTNAAFGRSSLFFLLDQILTHPPTVESGKRDHFWPILITGVTIPLGR
jgi:hypothetical protein